MLLWFKNYCSSIVIQLSFKGLQKLLQGGGGQLPLPSSQFTITGRTLFLNAHLPNAHMVLIFLLLHHIESNSPEEGKETMRDSVVCIEVSCWITSVVYRAQTSRLYQTSVPDSPPPPPPPLLLTLVNISSTGCPLYAR